jgi:hypothetical protein
LDHGDWEYGGDDDKTVTSFTPDEEAFVFALGEMWAHFADTRTPNPSADRSSRLEARWNWPAFENNTDMDVILAVNATTGLSQGHFQTEKHPRSEYCDFWKSLTVQ